MDHVTESMLRLSRTLVWNKADILERGRKTFADFGSELENPLGPQFWYIFSTW